MKAWVLEAVGKIQYKEHQLRPLKKDEVLVEIKAAGICGSDVPRIYRDGAHNMPLVPGHEFSGKVVKVGDDSCQNWMGKRVGVFPLIPCKKCEACKNTYYEMCQGYDYLGSRSDGGYGQYVIVPKWNLIELPDNISYEAAAMLEPTAVAIHSMRQAELTAGSKVLVYGLGTIGLLLAATVKNYCDEVYVIGNKDIQQKAIEKIGIPMENFCDIRFGSPKEWLNKKGLCQGIDVVYECVGRNDTIAEVIELTGAKGQLIVVGNPQSDINIEKNIYWRILRKQITLKGTWNSSFFGKDSGREESDDWVYAINAMKEGIIKPEALISHRFSIEEADKGLQLMRDKKEEYIKVMLLS